MPPYVAIGVHPRHDFLPGIAALVQAEGFPFQVRFWWDVKQAVKELGESLLGERCTLPNLRNRRRPLTPDINAFGGTEKRPYVRA